MYPPTTSCRQLGILLLSHLLDHLTRDVGPLLYHKLHLSHASRALFLSSVDLLPPRKMFRDSISPKDSVEEDIDTDVLADIEANATTVKVVADMDVEAGVDAGISVEVESNDRGTMRVGVDVVSGIDIPDGMLMPNGIERLEQVKEVVQEIYGHVMGIPLQRVEDIETGQRELEARSLIVSGERVEFLDRVASLERSDARLRGTLRMASARFDRFRCSMSFMAGELRQIRMFRYSDRMRVRRLETFDARLLVAEALAAYEANRVAELVDESQSQNRDDDDNGNVKGNENGNSGGNGDGNDGGNGNGNGGGNRNGNPNKNDRSVMPVTRECTYHDFVKCQPLNFKGTEGVVGLTRWFEKIETVFHIRNCLERFQELTMMCTKMAPEEEDRFEKFIGGLPDNIQGNVIAAEPTRLQDVVRIANKLMDQKLKGYAVKNAKNKRRLDNNHKDNRVQQPPYKRQNNNLLVHHEGPFLCENFAGVQQGRAYGQGLYECLSQVKESDMWKQSWEKEEKRLEDVPTVRDFSEVFPEDFPGLPPMRQVEFQIDLVPGAAPVARA
ncbi:hypothetical protein Tco_0267887 [Tanacetum coccineum]